MATRKATAIWKGTIKDGNGTLKTQSGALDGKYSFAARFEEAGGTNPEELIGAASAGCFSMFLHLLLTERGYNPTKIETQAKVTIKQVGEELGIQTIVLDCKATDPEIEDAEFQKAAKEASEKCPVSKALSAVKITLDATLEG